MIHDCLCKGPGYVCTRRCPTVSKTVKPTIYLDLDGVLADFDAGAGNILGTDNIYKWEFVHGPKAFWDKLNVYPNFFGGLPLKDDAMVLWNAVRALDPVVLTALPKKDATDVDTQKRTWVKRHLRHPFGSGMTTRVITCETKDKPNFCEPGDVLVDDRAVNREAWEAAGGIYVLHTSAASTVLYLKALGII
ncbi:hypothetical protein C7I87_00635 [Mesorhizobium sp. SARCC-RB16n]|uniref:hypothetical protein n=1 Tax=Mesorhizobium sp. SARCC-RB16n TaxID=2116687 RepID=UPI00122F1A87|nr:hypothetical protein [Mesorhizobium sp. SARCC-RB16n]KAA3452719.1 hypothetical protein C7I87_00635 [Mesorhizobium sp. SARCC-RB16n]